MAARYRVVLIIAALLWPLAIGSRAAAQDGLTRDAVTIRTLPPQPESAAARLAATLTVARRFARIRLREDCLAEKALSSDIIVCASREPEPGFATDIEQALAADLERDRFAQEICPSGVNCTGNIFAAVSITRDLIRLALDPQADLGSGARIPERFRGANR